MSDTGIIQQLTLNTPLTFTTATGIDRVKVHNDSGFYLRVYFGLGAPSSANGSGWHATVSPGGRPVLQVVGATVATTGLDFNNARQFGTYQGQVVVLPFLPAGAPLSSGGVISGGSFCYLTSYYPGEYAEAGSQIEAYVQGAKQGRTQVIMGAVERMAGSNSQADASLNMTFISNGAGMAFDSASMPNLFAANAALSSYVMFYYYGYHGDFAPGAAGAAAVNYHVQVQVTSSGGGVVRGERTVAQFKAGNPVVAPASISIDDRPTRPIVHVLVVAKGTLTTGDELRVLIVRDAAAGTWAMSHMVDFAIDIVNQNPLLDIPGIAVGIGGTVAYNSSYNPQTY